MTDLDWNSVNCFVAVCREGSMSDAAHRLNISVATVGRRIEALEASLGLQLLARGPSGTTPTDAGLAILKYAEPGARQIAQISRAARALKVGPPIAAVRISSTEPMIADVLAPNIGQILNERPGLKIELEVTNALSDLNSGATDIAVRLAAPTSETLIARRLPPIKLGLYCSADYLDGRDPNDLDLANESLLWIDPKFGAIAENVWIMDQGLEARAILRSSSVRSLQNAALSGIGIAPLPVFTAEKCGLLRIAGPALPKRNPWLVFHRDTRRNPQMKHVRDWIHDACRKAYGPNIPPG